VLSGASATHTASWEYMSHAWLPCTIWTRALMSIPDLKDKWLSGGL
jgi:hypothetical protein